MNKLVLVILMSFVGNCIAWLHMNAQFKWDWAKQTWWIIFGGIPISFLFYYSTRWSYEYFGYFWNIRLIGFGMGTLVFGLLAWLILNEPPNTKVIISLILSLVIILIQLSNVNLPVK